MKKRFEGRNVQIGAGPEPNSHNKGSCDLILSQARIRPCWLLGPPILCVPAKMDPYWARVAINKEHLCYVGMRRMTSRRSGKDSGRTSRLFVCEPKQSAGRYVDQIRDEKEVFVSARRGWLFSFFFLVMEAFEFSFRDDNFTAARGTVTRRGLSGAFLGGRLGTIWHGHVRVEKSVERQVLCTCLLCAKRCFTFGGVGDFSIV